MKLKLLFILSFLTFQFNFGQCLTDDFNSGYGNWTGSGTYQNTTAGVTGNGTGFNTNGDEIITNAIVTNPQTISIWLASSSTGANKTFSIQYSTTAAGPWTTVRDILNSEVTTTHQEFTAGLNLTGDYFLRLAMTQRSGGSYYLDDITVTCGVAPPCVAPTNQASSLTFNNISSNSIDGNFNGTTADSYLIVQSTSSTLSSNPIDGTTYTSGDNLGGGTVVQSSNATSFSATGLNATTTYYFFIFAYNNNACSGGDTYNTLTPLTGNETTIDGPCINEDFVDFSDWINNGTTTDNVVSHAGNSTPCRAIGTGDDLISPISNNPNALSFFQDASGGGSGNTATVDYRINGGAWVTFHSFTVTDAGNTETVDLTNLSGVDLSLESNVQFRFNSSFNTWYLDDVNIICGIQCTPTHTITSFTPTEGPAGTYVTISGTGFTTGTSVDLGNLATTVISQTATTLVVELPSNVNTGTFSIIESSCEVKSSAAFTVMLNSGSCTSGPSFTDIFISEVTDASSGSLSYIEIYNGTGADIDLAASSYALRFKNNGGIETDLALTGTLANSDSFIFATSVGTGCTVTGGDASYADQTEVFSGVNNNDCISLLKAATIIDVWGECDGSTWITTLGLGSAGYDFQRKATATAPNTTFDSTDWTIVDFDSCDDNYTDIESYAGSATTPDVTLQPIDVDTCSTSADFTITAASGNSGTLTYQWYFNNGSSAGWTIVNSTNLPLVTISGETTDNLILNGNISSCSGYQFYCLVTENGTCDTASDATQLKGESTTWNGTSWSNGTPTNTILAVLDSNYNTGTNGNLIACGLVINSGNLLTVANNSYIEITNNIVNNGQLIVNDYGSVVQINDAGTYSDASSTTTDPTIVQKSTAPINAWYEYTFWSSPVVATTLSEALPLSSIYRRFWFNAQNFQDSFFETNNDNTQTAGAGIDNVDDNANDWQVGGNGMTMSPGMGFAATLSPASFTTSGTYAHEFKDDLNTGTITTPVYRNDAELNDNNWNLIGNPYPSAIDVDLFFNENRFDLNASGRIEGAIYIWSHSLAPSATLNGNEPLNFDVNDYASINGSGAVAGGDNNGDSVVNAADIPNRFIPSCQSFLVMYSDTPGSTSGNVTFTNSMRVTGDNNQFFRNSSTNTPNKFWLNLSNDYGLYNQILVSYVNGATNGNDGSFYDAKRQSIVRASMALYSTSNNNELDDKFLIQGRNPATLNKDEVVNLGIRTTINAPTIFKFSLDKIQGEFLNTTNIYIKDKYLDKLINLKDEEYSFTSETGEFTDRFEIVFKSPQDDIVDVVTETPNGNLTAFETSNGTLSINTNSELTISKITIYNTLGKLLFNNEALNNSNFNLNINRFSNAMYLTQITLSNGETITKKMIKK